jgi:hypothetical protein
MHPPELRADVVCDGGPQVTDAERPACENAEQSCIARPDGSPRGLAALTGRMEEAGCGRTPAKTKIVYCTGRQAAGLI